MKKEQLIQIIHDAFKHVEYPGDRCLRGSNEGDEPYLLEEEFKGKDDWMKLDSEFLGQAPDGFRSALSFFSDEAFHFYLPAYMVADARGELEEINVYWYLCYGLEENSKNELINPRRYGQRTWFDLALHKFSMFDRQEANAIVAYLEYVKENDENLLDSEKNEIAQALNTYWKGRALHG